MIGDPTGLTLMAFSLSVLVICCFTCEWLTAEPAAMVAISIPFGGFAQVVGSILEFCRGNTYGGTICMGYACYWWCAAILYHPLSGLAEVYPGDEFSYALGWILVAWDLWSLAILLMSQKTSICQITLMVLVVICFTFLALGNFLLSRSIKIIGGYFGIAVAATAYYEGLAAMLTPEYSYFQLPIGNLSEKRKTTSNSYINGQL